MKGLVGGKGELPLMLDGELEASGVGCGRNCRDAVGDDIASQNLFFPGENWETLTYLADSARGVVDLIYIDPPYNTGSKFIYKDNRRGGDGSIVGHHAEWMSFMDGRLALAKQTMKPTGLIAVSVDDYEMPYLRIILEHVFGNENFIGVLPIARSGIGKGSAKTNFASNHEYVVIFRKSAAGAVAGVRDQSSNYDREDEFGLYRIDGLFRKKGDASRRVDRPNLFYPLYFDNSGRVFVEPASDRREVYPLDSNGGERRWLWSREKVERESWKLHASKTGTIYVKNYYDPRKRTKLRSFRDAQTDFYTNAASREVREIYGDRIFETAKPLALIEFLVDSLVASDALVFDFFAGTGTTAEAVSRLNRRDGGMRRVWLAESVEEIPKGHPARNHGFKTIDELTRFRLQHTKRDDPNFEIFEVSERGANRTLL